MIWYGENHYGKWGVHILYRKCFPRHFSSQIMILGDVRSVQVSQDGRYALVSFMDKVCYCTYPPIPHLSLQFKKACPQLWRIDPQDTNPSIEALDDNKSNASCYSLGGAETTEGHPTGGDDITLTRSKPRDNLIAHVRTFAPESPARSVGTSYFLGDYDQLVSCADKSELLLPHEISYVLIT
jgi:hypothetical protein